ncbi:MAG TPA: hypothetical protein PLW81_04615 [Thiobacillaceae bacterium]|nr:hypothetical protein [Thiobacillaceae bacterium]
MKVINLAAIRWFRSAMKDLPVTHHARQTIPERCRESFVSEVNWFNGMVAKAGKRDR